MRQSLITSKPVSYTHLDVYKRQIQPIHDIAALLEDRPTVSFHVDAVQALAKVATEVYLPERVDFATFSSHKFHGLRGVGFVYIKGGKKITPLLTGGGQEKEMRSTTENVAGIAATAKALRLAMEMCIRDSIGLDFEPEDIHVMRLNETEEEFDARIEEYVEVEEQEAGLINAIEEERDCLLYTSRCV